MSVSRALALCAFLTLAWGIYNPHKISKRQQVADKKKEKKEKPKVVEEPTAKVEAVVEPPEVIEKAAVVEESTAKVEAVAVPPEVVTEVEVPETVAQPEATTELRTNIFESAAFPTDNLTAGGSMLTENELPVTTIGIGFAECGIDVLGKVLASNPRAISGASPDKGYFNSKRGGKCNRRRMKKGNTTFQQYVNGCFEGQLPKTGETLLDVSADYSLFAFSGLVSDLKSMENETRLRFLAVVCDPRERALRAMKTNNGNESAELNYEELSREAAHTLRVHKGSGFSDTIAAGEYAKMLEEWRNSFPATSLLIINSKALKVTETWKRILMHAGLEIPPEDNLKKWLRRPLSMKLKKGEFRRLSHTVQKRFHRHYNSSDLALWRMTGTEWW